jgi:hypothetical protein
MCLHIGRFRSFARTVGAQYCLVSAAYLLALAKCTNLAIVHKCYGYSAVCGVLDVIQMTSKCLPAKPCCIGTNCLHSMNQPSSYFNITVLGIKFTCCVVAYYIYGILHLLDLHIFFIYSIKL